MFQTENRIFQKKTTITIKRCTIVIVVNQNLVLKACNIELEEKLHTFEIRLKLSFKGCCSLMIDNTKRRQSLLERPINNFPNCVIKYTYYLTLV